MKGWGCARGTILLLGLACFGLARSGGAATVYGLAGNGEFLVRFESQAPGPIDSAGYLSGLGTNERMVAIDFRPRTGQLYGIGATPGPQDTLRVYTIDPGTGVATILPGSTTIAATFATAYGAAFNPTVDRLRVVNSAD